MSGMQATSLGWAPAIPCSWKVVPLNFVAKMGTGHTPDRNKTEYWDNCTIPWVTTPDVTRRADSLAPLMETEQQISELGMANSAAVLHPTDTVMLSRTASVGYSVRIGRPMATTQAFVTWHAGPDLDPRYLLLVLRAMKQEWRKLAYGSTHLTIYMPDLESVRIPLPPLEEQRRIADFLDAETAHIDALTGRRTIQQQLLVERRAALKTKCVTYSGPHKVHHPLLGDIHPDWQVLPLRRILPAINVGVVINPSHYFTESGIPFIHGFNVREGFISQVGMKFMSGESNELQKRSRVYAGDVLVVRAGATAGRAAKVGEEFNGANCASVLILRKSEKLDAAYLETFLNAVAGKGQVSFSQYGAAQEVISAGQVASFSIALPPMSDQVGRVADLSAATAETIALESGLTRQVALLSERRQALITAAVTGQFDVSTASGRNVTDGVTA
ncbi:restriction endonuclease subunit S [Streptomyces virginiae]|uniref:restriction endonuclease subunit S n=1 Tax=Streptomyces virginiae TaxID=1961 RepID=UPI00364E1885